MSKNEDERGLTVHKTEVIDKLDEQKIILKIRQKITYRKRMKVCKLTEK